MNSRRARIIGPNVCSRCGGPVEPGYGSCAKCRQRQNERRKIIREKRKAAGICPYCGTNPIAPGKGRCKPCLIVSCESRERRSVVLRSMGLCQYCGVNPSDQNYPSCASCRKRNNEYVYKCRAKRGQKS